jgi:hypothetical protein
MNMKTLKFFTWGVLLPFECVLLLYSTKKVILFPFEEGSSMTNLFLYVSNESMMMILMMSAQLASLSLPIPFLNKYLRLAIADPKTKNYWTSFLSFLLFVRPNELIFG